LNKNLLLLEKNQINQNCVLFVFVEPLVLLLYIIFPSYKDLQHGWETK